MNSPCFSTRTASRSSPFSSLLLTIRDPSGESRQVPIPLHRIHGTSLTLGRSDDCAIRVKDPTLPEVAGTLSLREESGKLRPWLNLSPHCASASIASIPVRETSLPSGIALKLGETELMLQDEAPLPSLDLPKSVRPWKTASASGRELLLMTKKAASTSLSIYIAGETGSGKEVIAGLIHAWSDRSNRPFVPLHCGALSPSLAESELFGHVKGAFTGAQGQRTGALLQAHGGTLFLDEVGDLSLDLQVKLLRFLENGEIRPVGSDQIRHADVRVLCATHLPLRKLVEEGKFRRDLYYRLASITVEIPALRERPEDIQFLAREFAESFGKCIAPGTLLRLKAYSWPGNVRELRHAIERAAGLAGPFREILDDSSFDFLFRSGNVEERAEGELAEGMLTLEEMERVMILRSLKLAHGNRADAAKILGVARSTLFEMIKRHGIEGPRAYLRKRREANSAAFAG
jgi:transcriptional regulator with PAS, ATPase and Fis domain